MEFAEFKKEILHRITDKLGEGITVVVQSVLKNNGIELDGLLISKKESLVSPTIYLNSFYENYKRGQNISEIVEAILEIYENAGIEQDFQIQNFMNFELIKKQIFFKLINFEKNEKLLKGIPYFRCLDLAIVFYASMLETEEGMATVLIHDSHMKQWGVEKEELFSNATENAVKQMPAEINSMSEIMKELMGEELFEREENMYVLSNRQRLSGAGCILYPGILKQFAEKLQQDLYILPSSIHEVILLTAEKVESVEGLQQMVMEVNETQVSQEEFLSNQVYFYERSKNEIVLWGKGEQYGILLSNL